MWPAFFVKYEWNEKEIPSGMPRSIYLSAMSPVCLPGLPDENRLAASALVCAFRCAQADVRRMPLLGAAPGNMRTSVTQKVGDHT